MTISNMTQTMASMKIINHQREACPKRKVISIVHLVACKILLNAWPYIRKEYLLIQCASYQHQHVVIT